MKQSFHQKLATEALKTAQQAVKDADWEKLIESAQVLLVTAEAAQGYAK